MLLLLLLLAVPVHWDMLWASSCGKALASGSNLISTYGMMVGASGRKAHIMRVLLSTNNDKVLKRRYS